MQQSRLHHVQPALAAKTAGLPLIWALHSTSVPQPIRGIAGAIVSATADAILSSGASLAKRHGGLNLKKTFVFCAPVDVEQYSPDEEKRHIARVALGASPTDCVIGTLGNFSWQKNQGIMIEMAMLLRSRRGNICFRICGNNVANDSVYFEHAVRQRIVKENLGHIEYVRVIEQNLPADVLLNGFDIFVLPSRAEGLSVVTAEAAAIGLPILASDVGSVRDLIVEGQNGFLIKVNDTKLWAERALELGQSKSLREAFGASSREFSITRMGIDQCASDHATAYRYARNAKQ